jgi:hypothetical protein
MQGNNARSQYHTVEDSIRGISDDCALVGFDGTATHGGKQDAQQRVGKWFK